MAGILQRFEIDAYQINELQEAITLSLKYNLPAVVVPNFLVGPAVQLRGLNRGRFKIITVIDHPKGEVFGVDKFKGIIADTLEADGFEIMLTVNKPLAMIKNEIVAITNFVRFHVGQKAEVRFVLNALTTGLDVVGEYAQAFNGLPTPAFIRTDPQIKLQVSKANAAIHNNIISRILQNVMLPIKLSGNISNLKVVNECTDAVRYAVNTQQIKAISRELS